MRSTRSYRDVLDMLGAQAVHTHTVAVVSVTIIIIVCLSATVVVPAERVRMGELRAHAANARNKMS